MPRTKLTDTMSRPDLGAGAFLAFVLLLPTTARAQVLRENLWVTNGSVRAVATSAGPLSLAGSFTRVGPSTGPAVVLDAITGTTLPPYPTVVDTAYGDVAVGAVAPDGSGGWYIGGSFTAVLGQPRSNLAHL